DEQALLRFATPVALAIANARLLAQVGSAATHVERTRLGGEMHDGLAQVLAYVNVKIETIRELLKNGKAADAAGQLGALGEAVRSSYADVRESILGLRTSIDEDKGLIG